MNHLKWLIAASRMARHPPSPRRVMLILVAVAASLAIVGVEYLFGWPEWLTPDTGGLKP